MPDRPQFLETSSDQDLHQLLVPTPTNDGSRARDTHSNSSSDAGSFFIPEPLSRSNSVYSFSRVSLSSQLNSLTSMSLPQAESLAASITALTSSRRAIKALTGSAEQIMQWTKKALKVLDNLDADDDVEWAAAAGREALEQTDKTVNEFEHLVSMYVLSIEELQARDDIGDVRHEELAAVVEQMETTLDSWENVRTNLKKLHDQVELAMEWEELWNTVLADVGMELDSLSQLVFEMEDKRHQAYIAPTRAESVEPTPHIDLKELETFIEEPSAKKRETMVNARFSMSFESSPLNSPVVEHTQDDTDLLALFARMQPLRASLDFLPMRLSTWQQRAEIHFPAACAELDEKRERLEKNWSQLSEEAETLRRELSEDRWVVVFRNAGRQAQKMLDSVERTVDKVRQAVEEGQQRTNPASLAKRIESFDAKKVHYMPAVQRVLTIIQKGLKDRLTVNGEILRLHTELSQRGRDLEDSMDNLLNNLEPITPRHNGKMRDSVSSIVSADRSFSSGTLANTPGTSPASSVDLTPHQLPRPQHKYGLNGYSKPSNGPASRPPPPASSNRRTSLQPKRPATPSRGAPSPGPPSVYRQGTYRPPTIPVRHRQPPAQSEKPRWTAVISPSVADKVSGYHRPASTTPTTGNRLSQLAFSSSTTAIPFRSPLSRDATASPAPSTTTSLNHRRSSQQLRSFAERVASPSPVRSSLMGPLPYHKSRNVNIPSPGTTVRPASSLAVHAPFTQRTSIPIRPPSSLSRSLGTGSKFPIRVTPDHGRGHTPRSSIDSSRSAATSGRDHEAEEEDDHVTEHGSVTGSSPLNRSKIPRPASSLASSRGGKRVSLLPVPSGRMSSMGSHA